MAIYNDVLELIGHTPVVRLNHLPAPQGATVYGKLEKNNPGGSVKDRIAWGMILDAEKKGLLKPGATIVEPTSGNTGIGLAMVATVRGYKMILTMPDTMSFERRALLEYLGAQIVLTPGELGMKGSIDMATQLRDEHGYYMIYQFSNPANPAVHEQTTALEIVEDFKDLGLDYFVAGVGTGGTISGSGKILKQQFPGLKVIAVEPENSSVIQGKPRGLHGIQGIGAGFIPDNYNPDVVDEIISVKDQDAFQTARDLGAREGLLVGISAGACTWAAMQCALKAGPGKNILAILPDGAGTYMSTALFKRGY
ncbi:MAG: cysteine synthase A [SAR324 cluster bacterium]|nr:cysteine synthase A [SAR324 cluster bacterium]